MTLLGSHFGGPQEGLEVTRSGSSESSVFGAYGMSASSWLSRFERQHPLMSFGRDERRLEFLSISGFLGAQRDQIASRRVSKSLRES